MANDMQDEASVPPALTYGVGVTLREAREKTGKGVAEVATQLRIRQPFLQALEDGRHKDLPGGTYAVGFLRTYAEFLGLDGEEMVRRFRAEAAGDLDARSELIFPSPVSEGRIPGGAVLFLGILLAGLAYGSWYWLSARDTSIAELVPALPDRLASVLNRQADVAKPIEPAAKPDESPKPAELTPAPASATPAKDEVVPPSEDDEKQPEAVKAEPAHAVAPQPIKAVDPAPVKHETIPVKHETIPVKPVETVPAKPVETAPAKPVETTPTKPVEGAAAKPDPAPAPAGKLVGQEHADSRITLTATGDDCWMQVRELDGQLLLSRLLRKGDRYMVPNRPGLTLMVGNAGALDVAVDGKKAPALGISGQVRRDIKLDAEKLLAGG